MIRIMGFLVGHLKCFLSLLEFVLVLFLIALVIICLITCMSPFLNDVFDGL